VAVYDHAQRSRQPVLCAAARYAHASLDADDGAAAGWEIAVRATQSIGSALGSGASEDCPRQREVLMLAAVEELRYEEISTVLGVPIGR
jgi:DNA-directed RNA polymerase specialized sigma24 family protein